MTRDWDQTERRHKPDRRHTGRTGKYDRRRNRCGTCAHFEERGRGGDGWCNYHEGEIGPDDFACPMFSI